MPERPMTVKAYARSYFLFLGLMQALCGSLAFVSVATNTDWVAIPAVYAVPPLLLTHFAHDRIDRVKDYVGNYKRKATGLYPFGFYIVYSIIFTVVQVAGTAALMFYFNFPSEWALAWACVLMGALVWMWGGVRVLVLGAREA